MKVHVAKQFISTDSLVKTQGEQFSSLKELKLKHRSYADAKVAKGKGPPGKPLNRINNNDEDQQEWWPGNGQEEEDNLYMMKGKGKGMGKYGKNGWRTPRGGKSLSKGKTCWECGQEGHPWFVCPKIKGKGRDHARGQAGKGMYQKYCYKGKGKGKAWKGGWRGEGGRGLYSVDTEEWQEGSEEQSNADEWSAPGGSESEEEPEGDFYLRALQSLHFFPESFLS